MSKDRARAHFLGQHGHQKLNCGQTIIKAFQDIRASRKLACIGCVEKVAESLENIAVIVK